MHPFCFLLARRYRATITAVTALRSFIVSLISSPPPPFRRGHFAQISYMRQRIDFTQISDEAMRSLALPAKNDYNRCQLAKRVTDHGEPRNCRKGISIRRECA